MALASRIGTGNLAGVATAISVGGPGAVFWMWMLALLGAATAFVESTLAQLYKRRGKTSYYGGPAYYMKYGLGKGWMGTLFAVLITVTFGFAQNSVQSNTICAAWEKAFIILVSGVDVTATTGIQLTQDALVHEIGAVGSPLVAVIILMFAFSSIIGNYYYGETNVRYLMRAAWGVTVYRIAVALMVMVGAVVTLDLAWSFSDVTMAMLTLCNLVAIVLLSRQAVSLLNDYRRQKAEGKNPVFHKEQMPEVASRLEAW